METTLQFTTREPTQPVAGRRAGVDLHAHPVVVIIPAYNEERFIGSVVLKLRKYPVTVIVVDDGSSDETAALAEAAGATVIRHKRNRGKGQALNSGILAGRELQPEAMVMIDADGQHLPEQLPELVRPVLAGEADIVIGSRYLKQPKGVPRHRVLGHWFFNQATRLASGVQASDSQSGYRAFSPKAYNADLFHSSDFSVESEMQFLAHEHGLKVMEVPITIRYVDKPKRPVWQHGLVVLNGILRLTGQYRPLLFIGLPGLLAFLLGLGLGLRVVNLFLQTRQVAIGTGFASVLFATTGLVMLSTGIILHSVRGLLSEMLNRHAEDEEKD
jgi:glycosyltransferase involved in cell wall biosynthesis